MRCRSSGSSCSPPGRAAILGYTLPVWVALIGLLVYGERQGPRLVLALVAAAVGVGLLLAHELQAIAGSPLGTFCMLAAAAVWALGHPSAAAPACSRRRWWC